MINLVVLVLLFFFCRNEVVGQGSNANGEMEYRTKQGRFNVSSAVHQIGESSQLITRHIQDFHNYTFDGKDSRSIGDGGLDMYDGGNKIVLRQNGFPTAVEYGTLYHKTASDFFSDKIHPFTALWWIDNSVNSKFSIEVSSNFGADGEGNVVRYNGTVNVRSYRIRYHVFNLYGTRNDASVCEVYFVVENQQEWGSTSPKFTYMETAFDPRLETKNRAILSGSFHSVLFGYTLYSKSSGAIVTDAEVRAALGETVRIIASKTGGQQKSPTSIPHASASFTLTSTENDTNLRAESDNVTSPEKTRPYPIVVSTASNTATEDGQTIQQESTTEEPHRYTSSSITFTASVSTTTAATTTPDDDYYGYFEICVDTEFDCGDGACIPLANKCNGIVDCANGTDELNCSRQESTTQENEAHPSSTETSTKKNFISGTGSVTSTQQTKPSPLVESTTAHTTTQALQNGIPDATAASTTSNANMSTIGSTNQTSSLPELLTQPTQLPADTTYQSGEQESSTQEPQTSTSSSITSTENNVILGTGSDTVTPAKGTTASFLVTTTVAHAMTEAPQSDRFEQFLQRLSGINNLTTSVAAFYFYRYDNTEPNAINDGGGDMYDSGNKVYYYVDGQKQRVMYNRTYNGSTYNFTSLTTHPFIAFFNIETDDRSPRNYTINVQSNLGADGSGTFSRFSDSTSLGNYTIEYKVAQVYDGGDRTVCEVYFLVNLDRKKYGNFSFSLDTPIRDRRDMDNRAVLNGTVINAVFGYMLLSTETEKQIGRAEIRLAMGKMLQLILGVDIATQWNTSYFAKLLSRRLHSLNNVTNQIPSFHYYKYDATNGQIQINDGGRDMYDNGNKVYIDVDNEWLRINYNQTYSGTTYTFRSLARHPFLAFFYISDDQWGNYGIKVVSNLGADGSGSFERFAGNVTAGNYTIDYSGAQVHGAGDSTVCEVFFVLSLDQEYANPLLNVTSVGQGTRTMDNRAHVSGVIPNAIFGYTLLSKSTGVQVSGDEIKRAMRSLLRLIIGNDSDTTLRTGVNLSAAAPATTSSTDQTSSLPELLTPPTQLPADTTYQSASQKTLVQRLRNIANQIQSFYFYRYDVPGNNVSFIRDGGRDMYDSGNKVSFQVNNQVQRIIYNRTYSGPTYTFMSIAGHPFLAYFYITSSNSNHTYKITVDSNLGADGSGSMEQFHGNVTVENYTINYSGAQVFGASDPSVCEVFFVVSLDQESPAPLLSFTPLIENRQKMFNEAQTNGTILKGVFGYMLLSKEAGMRVSETEIQDAARRLLTALRDDPPSNDVTTHSPTTATFTTVPPRTTGFTSVSQVTTSDRFEQFLQRLSGISSVTTLVAAFYFYQYDNTEPNAINDGGGDMYDSGNKVHYYVNGQGQQVLYNRTYKGSTYNFTSLATHPFIAFFNIETDDNAPRNYTINVKSNLGTDGAGTFSRFSDSASLGNYTIEYKVAQVYDGGDRTVCEVYFLVNLDHQQFGNFSFTLDTPIRDRRDMNNRAVLNGSISNAVFGYVLLSTDTQGKIGRAEIRLAMGKMIQLILGVDIATQSNTSNFVKLLSRRLRNLNTVTNQVPSFYFYRYDQGNKLQAQINDGGRDMYDTGNKVYFEMDNEWLRINYNQTYSGPTYTFMSLAGHPFLAFYYINTENQWGKYGIKVVSDLGADGRGTYDRFAGIVTTGNYTIDYSGAQVFDAGDASVCKVFFVLRLDQGSTHPLMSVTSAGTGTSTMDIWANISGVISNTVFGYTLLSKSSGDQVSRDEIKGALKSLLHLIIGIDFEQTTSLPDIITQPTQLPTDTTYQSASQKTLVQRLRNIANQIQSFYFYRYDVPGNSVNHINDGGRDMYDGGNKVSFQVDNQVKGIIYNRTYSGPTYKFVSFAGHPFLAYFNITSSNSNHTYKITVDSNLGADGRGSMDQFGGNVTVENYTINYSGAQVFGTSDPSVCEVFFVVSLDQESPAPLLSFTPLFENRQRMLNEAQTNGTILKGVFGYMLLSKEAGTRVSETEIQDAARRLLNALRDDPPSNYVTTHSPTTATFTTVPPQTTGFTDVLQETNSTLSTSTDGTTVPIASTTLTTDFQRTVQFSTSPSSKTSVSTQNYTSASTIPSPVYPKVTSVPVNEGIAGKNATSAATTPSPVYTKVTSIPVNESITEHAKDLDFFPSCTAAQAIQAVFRCEKIFVENVNYAGPQTCRDILQRVFRCTAIQLYQCQQGARESKLDTMNLKEFNSMEVLSFMKNLSHSSDSNEYRYVNTFCHHAGLDLKYPHEIQNFYQFCDETFWNDLLMRVTKFFYGYAWARNKTDTCKAFQVLQSWFVDAARTHCSVDEVNSTMSEKARMYFRDLIRIAVDTVEKLDSITCVESKESIVFEDFDFLLFGGRFEEQDQDMQTSERKGESGRCQKQMIGNEE